MALYLDGQTRPYLERLVKNIKDTDFIGKRVQQALAADRERLEEIEGCDHTNGHYLGEKTACIFCGGITKYSWRRRGVRRTATRTTKDDRVAGLGAGDQASLDE